jgi:hypothetical protein
VGHQGDGGADALLEILGDIAVAVIKRVVGARVGGGVDALGEETAYAAGSFRGFAQVEAPEPRILPGDGRRFSGGVNAPGVLRLRVPAEPGGVGAGGVLGPDG